MKKCFRSTLLSFIVCVYEEADPPAIRKGIVAIQSKGRKEKKSRTGGAAVENLTDYCLEQSQKNTAQLFDMMRQTVTASAEMLNVAQGEVQKAGSSLTQLGAEQFLTQLEKLQAQQLVAHKEFEKQFRALMNVFRQEGPR